MGASNCKLIVVKSEKRAGYMPDPLMGKSIAEAQKRGVALERFLADAGKHGGRARGLSGGIT